MTNSDRMQTIKMSKKAKVQHILVKQSPNAAHQLILSGCFIKHLHSPPLAALPLAALPLAALPLAALPEQATIPVLCW